MKNSLKSAICLLIFSLSVSVVQSQIIRDINNLSSITFHEITGTASEHTFALNDNELNTKLTGELGTFNNDFQGWVGNEFFDVFFSNNDGSFNQNGMFITIDVKFDPSSGGGGGNIMEVQFNFENGTAIYASNLESFFVNGSNYKVNSELNAVDCDLTTFSTLGNTQGISQNLRLTVGLQNTYSEMYYSGCETDDYSIEINGTLYDKNNPRGTEIFTTGKGCDSLVNINLDFIDGIDTTQITYQGCLNDNYSIEVNGTTYDENNKRGVETFITDSGCDSIINIVFEYFNTNDTTFISYQGCEGDSYSITVNNTVYNQSNPEGIETLSSNYSCDSIINIQLTFNSCNTTTIDDCEIYIPNIFSPNSDGHNDFFSIYQSDLCNINDFTIKIYDRWGSKTYESDNIEFRWDGSFRENTIKPNVYVWHIEYSNISSGRKETLTGDVLLVR